jgi:hypothetical protein
MEVTLNATHDEILSYGGKIAKIEHAAKTLHVIY